MSTQLVRYDAACRALAAAKSVDQAAKIRDGAEALRAYGRIAKNRNLELDGAEIRIRAERRIGELVVEQRRTVGLNLGARGTGSNQHKVRSHRGTTPPTLAAAGIDKKLSMRAQRLAQLRPPKFEELVAAWRAHLELEHDRITTDLLRGQKRDDVAARRAAAAAAAKAAMPEAETVDVHLGSFVDLAETMVADSVDLVFTDPPYHDKAIGLYADLGTVAARVLKDGASLITYTSHHRLPEVIGMLQAAGLTFFWPIAMIHSGPNARMTEYGIVVHWKPLLWFVKGRFRRRDDMRFVNDAVFSQPEKDAHPWQQGRIEARYYIDVITEPGDLVFDPFCGGGTTAVAAAETHRRWITCDVDDQAVYLARQRVRDALRVTA